MFLNWHKSDIRIIQSVNKILKLPCNNYCRHTKGVLTYRGWWPRQWFYKIFWRDDDPWVEGRGKELKIFRVTRIILNQVCSIWQLLSRIPLQNCAKAFLEYLEILNSSLYVDDFTMNQPNVNNVFNIHTLLKHFYQQFFS